MTLWAGQWHDKSKLNGETRHILYENCFPKLFHTRREARNYIKSKYGYIRDREDLRAEPFGWRIPQAVKIRIVDAQYDIGQWTKANEYIKRGLLRIKRTGEPVKIPAKLECVLCKDNGHGHLLEALESRKEDIESHIEYSQERIDKMQSDINDEEYSIEHAKINLEEISEELKQAQGISKLNDSVKVN